MINFIRFIIYNFLHIFPLPSAFSLSLSPANHRIINTFSCILISAEMLQIIPGQICLAAPYHMRNANGSGITHDRSAILPIKFSSQPVRSLHMKALGNLKLQSGFSFYRILRICQQSFHMGGCPRSVIFNSGNTPHPYIQIMSSVILLLII